MSIWPSGLLVRLCICVCGLRVGFPFQLCSGKPICRSFGSNVFCLRRVLTISSMFYGPYLSFCNHEVFIKLNSPTLLVLVRKREKSQQYFDFSALQVHVPQKPQKKRVVIIFFLLVDFKNGFVSMKGCRKRGLPVGYYYFLPKIDRVLM